MLRIGVTIGIKEDKIEEYKKLHAKVWPEVLENLTELNFKNYSIYLHKNTLFGYMEYHGNDIKRDNVFKKIYIDAHKSVIFKLSNQIWMINKI